MAAGFVMTAATGARRTASAWPRMRTYTEAPDIESWVYSRADELESALRARPDVVATGQYAWMFVFPVVDGPVPPAPATAGMTGWRMNSIDAITIWVRSNIRRDWRFGDSTQPPTRHNRIGR